MIKGIPGGITPNLGKLRYWLGTFITLLSMAFLLRGVDVSRIADAFGSIDYIQVVLALLTIVLTILLKAIRWKMLFQPPSVQPSTARAISIWTIGQMINSVFPFRFGEVGRVYLAAELEDSPMARTTATIVVEKTIDSLMLLICAALVLPFVPLPIWLRQPVLAASVLAIVAITMVITLARWRQRTRSAVEKALAVLPRQMADFLIRHVDVALDSFAALRRPRVLARIALLSVVIWILAALTNYTAFLSLSMTTPFAAAVFLLVVLQIGVAVPSAPARVGVFQALTVLGLSLFGVDPSVALTYSIVLHVLVFLPPSVVGAALLWFENKNIRDKSSQLSNPETSASGGIP